MNLGSLLRLLRPKHVVTRVRHSEHDSRTFAEDRIADDVLPEIDRIRSTAPGWSSRDICFIEELVYSADASTLRLRCLSQPKHVDRRGWPDPAGQFWLVELEFEGVHGVELSPVTRGSIQVEGFEILDVRHRQWESTRFEVHDFEGEVIHFYAAAARLLEITVAPTPPSCTPFARVFSLDAGRPGEHEHEVGQS